MRCLKAVLLLAGLATAVPQAATVPGPDSAENVTDSSMLPTLMLAGLPSNVPIDLWSSTRPPIIKREDNLRFSLLHCDGAFKLVDFLCLPTSPLLSFHHFQIHPAAAVATSAVVLTSSSLQISVANTPPLTAQKSKSSAATAISWPVSSRRTASCIWR